VIGFFSGVRIAGNTSAILAPLAWPWAPTTIASGGMMGSPPTGSRPRIMQLAAGRTSSTTTTRSSLRQCFCIEPLLQGQQVGNKIGNFFASQGLCQGCIHLGLLKTRHLEIIREQDGFFDVVGGAQARLTRFGPAGNARQRGADYHSFGGKRMARRAT